MWEVFPPCSSVEHLSTSYILTHLCYKIKEFVLHFCSKYRTGRLLQNTNYLSTCFKGYSSRDFTICKQKPAPQITALILIGLILVSSIKETDL